MFFLGLLNIKKINCCIRIICILFRMVLASSELQHVFRKRFDHLFFYVPPVVTQKWRKKRIEPLTKVIQYIPIDLTFRNNMPQVTLGLL